MNYCKRDDFKKVDHEKVWDDLDKKKLSKTLICFDENSDVIYSRNLSSFTDI